MGVDPRELLEQAVAAHRAGRLDEAAGLYRAVLAVAPEDPNALTNLGTVALQQGRLGEGVSLIEASLRIKPGQANAINNRANALLALGRLAEALAGFDAAVALDPANAEAHANRGVALGGLGRPEEAEAAYRQAVVLRPDFVNALNGLGTSLEALGRAAEAAEAYDRALALAPEVAQLHINKGNALRLMNRPVEALAAYDQALALGGETPDLLANRAMPLQTLMRLDEAMASCERAIALDPEHVNSHWNRALLRLMTGDYAAGWQDYEWRWKQPSFASATPPEGPRWTGEASLAGAHLLMVCEQGFGDTLQMLRYAALAAEKGAEVLAIVQPELAELAGSVEGLSRVLVGGEPITYEAWIPMMSLPAAFGTTLATVPGKVPYIATPAAARAAWARRLGARRRPRVGLAWSGRASHANDANRSLSLETLAPLLAADADFISLQNDYRPADRAFLEADGRIADHAAQLTSFTETAGLIEQLDLVISVDTSVAHLAGALGRPLLLMLPFSPDYRWGIGAETTPWYPTARLLRQQAAYGDWSGPVKAALEAVRKLG